MTPYKATASVIIKAPLEKVWDGLTKPELVKRYFFNTDLITTWTVGEPINFRGEWQGKPYEDKGTVLEFVPLKTLSYDYYSALSGKEDKPESYQIIRYTVEKRPEGVMATIDQSNAESQESADHSSKNWKMVLESLKKLIETE